MAGIYIHIPYCKQACHYCNFHFSTTTDSLSEMIPAICKELQLRKSYLNQAKIESIYFGGGTPSMVPTALLQTVLDQIQKDHHISDTCEITLEANPDDIELTRLQDWVNIGINRLSLGVQSFHDDDLFFMNRAHSGTEALEAISIIAESDIKHITADIIFGYDGLTEEKLQYNLEQVFQNRIHHLSCYAMTVEVKTALHHQIKTGKVKSIDERISSEQFSFIKSVLQEQGYDHYEISNYARHQEYALHNTNYWKNKTYLGVGPSAHSYNQSSREWNIANNSRYLKQIHKGEPISEVESLSQIDKYNEYIMTGLRTKWGIDIDKIKSFGQEFFTHFQLESGELIQNEKLVQLDNTVHIHDEFLILCDSISSKLFYT